MAIRTLAASFPKLPSVVNKVAPSIEGVAFGGGAYSISEGVWSGGPALTLTHETSDDGSAWADAGAIDLSGNWAASLAGKFIRVKVTPDEGAPAYSAAFGPLGPAYDQVLKLSGDGNWLQHPVTAPFLGQNLIDAGTSLWFSACFYFPGSGFEGGGVIAALGSETSSLRDINLRGSSVVFRSNDGISTASVGDPELPGWYIATGIWDNDNGSTLNIQYLRNEEASGVVSRTARDTVIFDSLRIGAPAAPSITNAQNLDLPIHGVAFGTGDPTAAHAWAYNDGKIRDIADYDFASDANASLDGYVRLSRVSPGSTTFSAASVVDEVGGLDSWTQAGSLAWEARAPGYVFAGGDPLPVPATYIYPTFGRTDSTYHLGDSASKIGEATGITINTLTHDSLGDLSGTVTNGTFTCTTPGIITFDLTGPSGNAAGQVEVIEPLAIGANPQFADAYGGNGLVAAIEPYPATGTGTTYASVAALETDLSNLTAGATLVVNDLAASGTRLTIPSRDYGGAVLEAKNLYGIEVADVRMPGVANLTIRGVKAIGDFFGDGVTGLTMDHCTGSRWYVKGASVAATFKISNWMGPDDGTALPAIENTFDRVTLHRVAHANTTGEDNHRTDRTNIIIADRVYFGQNSETDPAAHSDLWQTYLQGSDGYKSGLIQNCVGVDRIVGAEVGAQGLFFSDGNARGLLFFRCAFKPALTQTITMAGAQQACGIEECTGSGPVMFTTNALVNSVKARNNVRSLNGNLLPSTSAGVEEGTVKTGDFSTIYPQFDSHADSWEAFANPASGFESAGAAALIAELAAAKALLQ